jgi:hypothetical protein
MSDLAERIVHYLTGAEMLFEDKIDDLIQKHGQRIPGDTPEAKRQTLEQWAGFDPTRNKKYFPWIFRQFITGKVKKMDEHTLDHIRDMLSDYEHYLTMPAFQGDRDIFQYDYKTLQAALQQASQAGLASKKDVRRGRVRRESNVINQVGDMEIVGFKDGNSLAAECWRGYAKENPNWDGPPHYPADPEYNRGDQPYFVDKLWCTRNPERASGYIEGSPSKTFYIIRKKGWPWAAAVLSDNRSQIQNLHNTQVDMGMVEKLYDLMKPVLDHYAANKWSPGRAVNQLFGKLRIIRGELQPGETIQGGDFSNSTLSVLPENLTVDGNLDISGCPISVLPNGLTVKGNLVIANTAISQLPPGLTVKGSMNLSGTSIKALSPGLKLGNLDISNTGIAEIPAGLEVTENLRINGTPVTKLPNDMKVGNKVFFSPETLPDEEIRRFYFYWRFDDMKVHFWRSNQVAGKTEEQTEVEWVNFQPTLMDYYKKDQKILNIAISAMFEPVAQPRPVDRVWLY